MDLLTPDAPLTILKSWLSQESIPLDGVFLVGGSIRDMVLGRPLKDVDLVCSEAESFAARLAERTKGRLVPLGQNHDPPSYRLVFPKEPRTSPFGAIDLTRMHGRDIVVDLGRRDFTANSMALELSRTSPILIDPFHGLEDIHQGILRQVDSSSVSQDPLRILRGFRLSAQLGWSIEPATLAAFSAQATALDGMAAERIAVELGLILGNPRGGEVFREMERTGVLDVLFPEIQAMRGCTQNHFHHLDVLDHSLMALDQCGIILGGLEELFGTMHDRIRENLSEWRLPWLKLAVFMHDFGKPETKSRNPSTNRITFYGHDEQGAAMAQAITARLRLSEAECAYIVALIRHHLHIGALLQPEATTKVRMRWMRRLGHDLIPTALLCLADIRATLGSGVSFVSRQNQEARIINLIQKYLGQVETILKAPPLITGHDLLSLGLSPGPALGRILHSIREAQDAGEISTRDQALELGSVLVADCDLEAKG
jgi:tRNA nucleotidyltransferase/poly(A) polymerase